MSSHKNSSIALRLLGLILGMFLTLLLITIATTLLGLSQFEQRVMASELAEEQLLFQQSMQMQQDHLRFTALVLAEDASLLAAVQANDRAMLQRVAIPLQVRYQLDHLKLAGSAGQTLLHTGPTPAETQVALRRALLTIEQASLGVVPEGVMLLAAVPIKGDDGLTGALVVGQLLNDRLLHTLNAYRDDPLIGLYTSTGELLASSTRNEAALRLADRQASFWQRVGQGEVSEAFQLGRADRYQVTYAPLNPGDPATPIYSIALSTNLFQTLRFAIVQQNLIILVLVALITTGVLVTSVRTMIVRPLGELDAATARVGDGELDLQLTSERNDEIGRLTNSFGAMTARLRALFAALDARNQELETEQVQIETARAQLQREVEQAQRTIMNMVMPLIPIDRQTIIVPLVGALDEVRATQLLATLLEGVEQRRARVAIIDITGVPVVDQAVAQILHQAVQGVRLLGAQVIITGIQPEVAQSMVGVGLELEQLQTYATLEQAISAVNKRGGSR
ncbi:STAS domain-containing protein [Candidatus Viridilinea mediisalina]|nr:STAS domain-containing protein [Candidatus Viridilinea mediisalina]